MSVSDSETYDNNVYEEGEIPELNLSYYTLYMTNSTIQTFILFDENQFIVYGSKRNRDGSDTPFYAKYFLCQIDSLATFLFFIFQKFDAEIVTALYTIELDKYSLSDYGFDFIYNRCGPNECLVEYPSYRMNMKRLYTLMEMIEQ